MSLPPVPDVPNVPVHSYHMNVSNRDFVIDAIQRCVKPYGIFPVYDKDKVPPEAARYRFYLTHYEKGWISVTDSGYFAQEELARRTSTYLPGKVVLLWADPAEAWGYQFYDTGSLMAEYVSDMVDLHREWFEEEPTAEEMGRFSGNPELMKEHFGKVGFSLREMKDVYGMPPEQAMEALHHFGGQLQIQDPLMHFDGIEALPITERLGPRGFLELDFYQKYNVDVAGGADEIEFPEDAGPSA